MVPHRFLMERFNLSDLKLVNNNNNLKVFLLILSTGKFHLIFIDLKNIK
jgi:hypothetical protein